MSKTDFFSAFLNAAIQIACMQWSPCWNMICTLVGQIENHNATLKEKRMGMGNKKTDFYILIFNPVMSFVCASVPL